MNMISVSAGSSALAARAMVVSLSISQWSGRRLDRQATDEVNSSHGAADDAGRYNKLLLPKEALADIQKIVGATRRDFLERTLPWIDDGGRIMAADAYMAHTAWLNGQKTKFSAAVDAFVASYPKHIADARGRLKTLFKAEDYPAPEELTTKFSMAVTVLPVPTANDFRVDMSEAQARAIRLDIERNVREATATAVRDVYGRIAKVTGHMVERLDGYRPGRGAGDRAEGTFRDSLVENVRDLINIMPALNIVGDPMLATVARDMQALVRYSAETLRKDEARRLDVAEKAKAILDQVSDFI